MLYRLIGPDGESAAPPPPKPHPAPESNMAPHGASTRTAPSQSSTPRPSSAPSQATQHFDQAVQQALAARAAAEGQPAWTHGYESATIVESGDTLFGIAAQHGNTLPTEEGDNAQISDPNLIYPGEAVFSPGPDPVSPATTALIQDAERSGSQQAWAKAQAGIENDLRAQGQSKLQPDEVVQPTVRALDAWATGNDKLRQATENAYNAAYSQWQSEGVTSRQISPILQDRAAAVQDDNALSHLRSPTNRAIVQAEQQQASEAWSKVQQDTQYWLQSSIGLKAFPEDTAAARVKELDALHPGDQKFAAANHAALQAATQTWNALGITHAKLDPVMKAYNAYQVAVQQRQQALSNPHLHNEEPDAQALLNQPVNAAQHRLEAVIQHQLTDAGKQASSPQQAGQAMLEQAGILANVGPQTSTFKDAVNAATNDVEVDQPAKEVAAAYRQGGAQAASQALVGATQNAAPGYAGRIIAASGPTIDRIASDLNDMTQNSTQLANNGQFTAIYGNLSEAVEQTDHGPNEGGLSNETKAAANVVADALASHMRTNKTFVADYGTFNDPAQALAISAQDAIGNRQGASLSLALGVALRQRGQGDAANEVVEGAAQGYDELKTRTDSDVQSFAKVTANLEQLRSSWAPFMTNGQLNAATEGYARRNPGFVQQFGQTLTEVQQDGTAIVQARQAFSAYRSDLNGLSNRTDLTNAANNLTGHDASSYFAVQQSGQVTMNVARALAGNAPAVQSGYSTGMSAPGVLRSIRTGVNQYLKSSKTTPLTDADGKATGPNVLGNLALSATGLGLTAPNAVSELEHFNQLDFAGKAVTAYNTLGFAKYFLETGSYASRMAKTSGIRFLGAIAESKGGSALANLTGKDAATGNDLPAATGFKLFGSFYYLTGAFANGVSAYDAASTGDPVTAGLDSANALGNVLLAGNASRDAIGATLSSLGLDAGSDAAINALDWAGPVGAGLSILAQFGLAAYSAVQQKDAQNALQSQGQDFLEDGLHLRSSVAYQLADVSDNQHEGPAPVLQAYAQQYGIKPQALLDFLNKQNPNDVGSFVYLAEFLTPGKNGRYPVSSPSDTSKLYYIPGVLYQNTEDVDPNFKPPLVDSQVTPTTLRQLHYWAEAIFGAGGPTATS
jgi:hypothetical protein